MTDLPEEWTPTARSQAEKKRWRMQMMRGLCEILDAELDSEFEQYQRETGSADYVRKMLADDSSPQAAVYAANYGNFGPMRALLRRLHPGIEKFVRFKKPESGRWPRPRPRDVLDEAVADVRRIRDIWKRRYGRRNRKRDDVLCAEDVAVWRWRDITDAAGRPVVTRASIAKRMKPSGASGRPRKKPRQKSRAKKRR